MGSLADQFRQISDGDFPVVAHVDDLAGGGGGVAGDGVEKFNGIAHVAE
jgi:hypothetical protein